MKGLIFADRAQNLQPKHMYPEDARWLYRALFGAGGMKSLIFADRAQNLQSRHKCLANIKFCKK